MKQKYEITGEQLVVSTDIPILSLWDMEIACKVNEHGTLVLIAALPEEQGRTFCARTGRTVRYPYENRMTRNRFCLAAR